MRKLLFLTYAFVLGISAYAQTGVFQQEPNAAGHTRLFTPHKASLNKIEPTANQIWWGYQAEAEERSSIGVSKAETYAAAIFVAPGNAVIVGKTIKAIRFYLRDKANTNNIKVWISKTLPDDVNSADYVQNIDETTLTAGDESEEKHGIANDVELTTPYIIGTDGVYIGYSVTVADVSESATKFPIVTFEGEEANSFFIRTSSTSAKWSDLAEEGFGKLALQILVEGKFVENSASPDTMEDIVLLKNGTGKSKLVLFNGGSAGINSIDYTITTDGVAGAEQHLDINPPVKTMGAQCTIDLPLTADSKIGISEKSITITKVNGKANEAEKKSATFKLTTVGKQVKRGVVVEENTGTGCGWCPRGWAGMKKMRDKFGENFIGIAIHQFNETDAMYCPDYAELNFSEAPACRIDRDNAILDPFYGTEEDICADFKESLAHIATVGVSVTGKLNADCTQVTATATIEPLVNGTYEIAYALIGDELTGTDASWQQNNYYYKYVSQNVSNDPYLSPFCKDGKYGSAKVTLNYDDVLLTGSYKSTTNNAKLAPLQEGKVVTNTYTLTLPTKNTLQDAIKKAGYNKLAVIAMIIRSDGKIDNAAKFYLQDPTGVEGISENKGEPKEVARYTIDGRKISAPQHGLNIVKMSDGSTVKVLVK
ncbi:hypothetical protein [Prevotella falsenii]|uniref:hypothetical protein n=1 Tax=Prevotella falsenii TaxID=515414 RepID=UPI00046AAF06|nr:hypothetical protein [Prevotella falsenii]